SDVLEILGRSGRSMQENGQPVTDPTEALRIARGVVDEILQRRLPLFQRLGVVAKAAPRQR
ncbi:MAG: hypothetical protein JO047_04990, partial [Alphaproteobacteria bacterium]|nr:hypothetical protein [Alphaproteobacteria bacterium]